MFLSNDKFNYTNITFLAGKTKMKKMNLTKMVRLE